jgi:hypothetical protein
MAQEHGNFAGNTAAFSELRRKDAEDTAELGGAYIHGMNEAIAAVMPEWPSTINAPGMGPPAPADASLADGPPADPPPEQEVNNGTG